MTVSLTQQIDEVQRELTQRARVYPRLIANRTLRASIAEFQVQRLEAVLATLRWLHTHEPRIKEALNERHSA